MTSAISSVSSTLATGIPSTHKHKSLIDDAAGILGMSTDDVKSALKSGKSLADLATQQGISEDDLVSGLEADAPKELQGNSNLAAMTKKLVETQGLQEPAGPPPGHGTTGVLSGTMTDDQSSTLDSLSSLLGTDSDSLMTQLQSGTSLADLASSGGVTYNQLASVIQTGLLIDTSM